MNINTVYNAMRKKASMPKKAGLWNWIKQFVGTPHAAAPTEEEKAAFAKKMGKPYTPPAAPKPNKNYSPSSYLNQRQSLLSQNNWQR